MRGFRWEKVFLVGPWASLYDTFQDSRSWDNPFNGSFSFFPWCTPCCTKETFDKEYRIKTISTSDWHKKCQLILYETNSWLPHPSPHSSWIAAYNMTNKQNKVEKWRGAQIESTKCGNWSTSSYRYINLLSLTLINPAKNGKYLGTFFF